MNYKAPIEVCLLPCGLWDGPDLNNNKNNNSNNNNNDNNNTNNDNKNIYN